MNKSDKAIKSRLVREFREKRDAAICRMHAEGVKRSGICSALNCHPRTVNMILARYGQNRVRPRRMEPTEADLRAIDRYRDGFSLRQVAAESGVTMQRVHQIIRQWAPEIMRPPSMGMNMSPAKRLEFVSRGTESIPDCISELEAG